MGSVSVLDDALKARIKQRVRTKASARHVPNEAYGNFVALAATPRGESFVKCRCTSAWEAR